MYSSGLKRSFGLFLAVPVVLALLLVSGCGDGGDTEANGTEGRPGTGDTAKLQTGAGESAKSDDGFVPAFSEVKQDKGPVFGEGCLITGGKPESGECAYGSVDSPRQVVVLGDSHALQWTPALIEIATRRGWRLVALLHANCTAAQVSVNPDCDRWRENALARIKKERPGLVVVASNTGPNMTVQSGGETLDREAAEPLLESGMAKTFRDLGQAGAEVTLIQDMAMSKDYLPSECVAENRSDPAKCTFVMDRPPALAYDLKAAEEVGGIEVIDPLERICPGYVCDPVHGNYLKFRDRFHITATYSKLLAPWLDQALQNPW